MNQDDVFDELRILAQNGLEYADNEYDRRRYTRILTLVSDYYANQFGLSSDEVMEGFKEEVGHVTPKVGSVAGIVNESGEVLLIKRSDTNLWSLPGGWLEPNESPEEAAIRETKEETGLDVAVIELLKIFTRRACEGYGPHGAVGFLYYCEVDDGIIDHSQEVVDIQYADPSNIEKWHQKHEQLAIDVKQSTTPY